MVDKGLLGHLLNFKDVKGQTLTEDQIADNIIGVLFAAHDTTASVITWILKFLHDDPKLLEAVKVINHTISSVIIMEKSICLILDFLPLSLQTEQKAIYESNNRGKNPLTWAQKRNMPLTHRVSTAYPVGFVSREKKKRTQLQDL